MDAFMKTLKQFICETKITDFAPNQKKWMKNLEEKQLKDKDIEHHEFKAQQKNHDALSHILAKSGDKFHTLQHISFDQGGAVSRGFEGPGTRADTFRAHSKNLVWHKYEGPNKGSGQNYVIVHGRRHKTTQFLKQPDEAQQLRLQNRHEDADKIKPLSVV